MVRRVTRPDAACDASGLTKSSFGSVAEWLSGLRHPTYNRGERVHARSAGPNPAGPAQYVSMAFMTKKKEIIVEESQFNAVLSRLLKAKPVPMKKIKTTGKRRSGSLIPAKSGS